MRTIVPTAEEAQALHQFIQDRNEDDWQQTLADDTLSAERLDSVRRLSNTAKLSLAGTAAYLLVTLTQGQTEQAARLWDNLTACGEEWQDHVEWRPSWANPARASLERR